MKCRACEAELEHIFIDLQYAPLSNSFLTQEDIDNGVGEVYYPLKAWFCQKCYLVQLDEFRQSADIFNANYVYFSSFSRSWLKHAQDYVAMVIERFGLNKDSFVVEIASNDGYLLQYFKGKGIPCLGVEPSSNTAQVAKSKGIETIEEFFCEDFVSKYMQEKKADLVLGNNVLAHVPDIKSFIQASACSIYSARGGGRYGYITFEFPHLLNLVQQNQFDTIYHEHFSYLSLHALIPLFENARLRLFDVEQLSTHGGSLRVFLTSQENPAAPLQESVARVLQQEKDARLTDVEVFTEFTKRCAQIKIDVLDFLIQAKKEGKKVAAYGAAAKGNTLLNYCGIKSDLVDFVCDLSPHKQGLYLPGSHIPVLSPDVIKEEKPDYIIIFAWNIYEEIMTQLSYVKDWQAKFVTCIPSLQIH